MLKVLAYEDEPFAQDVIAQDRPVIIRNSHAKSWPAVRQWSLRRLADLLGGAAVVNKVGGVVFRERHGWNEMDITGLSHT
jgi:hypothetical protein